MEIINFSFNWNNKLNNKYFTSIRNWTYDRVKINEIYRVSLDYDTLFHAKLIDYYSDRLIHLRKDIIVLDTGMEYDKAINLFKHNYINSKDIVYVLLFEKIEGDNNERN